VAHAMVSKQTEFLPALFGTVQNVLNLFVVIRPPMLHAVDGVTLGLLGG
jgi:hypothetical protein